MVQTPGHLASHPLGAPCQPLLSPGRALERCWDQLTQSRLCHPQDVPALTMGILQHNSGRDSPKSKRDVLG